MGSCIRRTAFRAAWLTAWLAAASLAAASLAAASLAAVSLAGCAESSDASRAASSGGAGALAFPACLTPSAPVLEPIHPGAVLSFRVPSAAALEIGTATDAAATAPDAWTAGSTVTLPETGAVTVFARVADPSCDAAWFAERYLIAATYPGPAGTAESPALAMDDAAIVGWAASVSALTLGPGSTDPNYQDPALALGAAQGTAVDALSLGDGGAVTLTFAPPLTDGEGAELAVFENGFNDAFLELAFVEVSSDGNTFVRFDSAYLGHEPVPAFGEQATTLIAGLAGKYRQGYGTPFDFATLRTRPEVQAGAVDLSRIGYVRIQDILGDGSATDSFGHPIYDPTPTVLTAGFDLDAVAALHVTTP